MNEVPTLFIGTMGSGLSQFAESSGLMLPLLLLLSVFIPIAIAVSLAISGQLGPVAVRAAALLGFVIPGMISIFLAIVYISLGFGSTYAFELVLPMGLERFGIYLHLGLNGISMPMYLLAGVVGMAAGVYAIQSQMERQRLFLVLLLIMQGGLLGVFASVDIFFFYFFHEFALIPTFVMIAMWGRRGRKGVALELTIYLTLGAMITLAGLIALYGYSGMDAFNMIELRNAIIALEDQSLIFGLLLIGFGILVSLFPFHSWAPRGYATAPAPAAMLHAGVLKKFGLYGLIQIAWPLLPEGFAAWSPLLLWLALGNIVLIGFVTLVQRDLKMMLGNASVMHMGYAFLGLYAYSSAGIGAALMMMFAHGLSVGLLFLLADVIEKRGGEKGFEGISGLGTKAPVLMAFFVAAIMASIGLPGFANFWGELGIFVALFGSASPWAVYVAIAGIVISAIYGLRAVANLFFGEPSESISAATDIKVSEKLPAVLLLFFLFAIGIWPKLLTGPVDQAVSEQFQSVSPETVSLLETSSKSE